MWYVKIDFYVNLLDYYDLGIVMYYCMKKHLNMESNSMPFWVQRPYCWLWYWLWNFVSGDRHTLHLQKVHVRALNLVWYNVSFCGADSTISSLKWNIPGFYIQGCRTFECIFASPASPVCSSFSRTCTCSPYSTFCLHKSSMCSCTRV